MAIVGNVIFTIIYGFSEIILILYNFLLKLICIESSVYVPAILSMKIRDKSLNVSDFFILEHGYTRVHMQKAMVINIFTYSDFIET